MRFARLVVSIVIMATCAFAGCGGKKKAVKQAAASPPKASPPPKTSAPSRPPENGAGGRVRPIIPGGPQTGPAIDSLPGPLPVPPLSGRRAPDVNTASNELSPSFQPPFPNRTNPFLRPNFAQSVKTNSASQEDIKLRGFVNVNGVRALLAINGKINRVQEGETRQGVQVIRILPPNVILQKGRVRWTQKLFDGKPRRDSLRAGLPPNSPF